jgi:hypothetical protein
MLYLYPQRAHFYRPADHDRLAAMDGAEDRGSCISFDTTTPEGVQHALAAAQAVSRTLGTSGGIGPSSTNSGGLTMSHQTVTTFQFTSKGPFSRRSSRTRPGGHLNMDRHFTGIPG